MAKETQTQHWQKEVRTHNLLCKRLFTLREAAEYLGRSEWGMRDLVWSGAIPAVRSGRKIFLDIFDLESFVDRNKSIYR